MLGCMNIEGEHLPGSAVVRVSVIDPLSIKTTGTNVDAINSNRLTGLLHREMAKRV